MVQLYIRNLRLALVVCVVYGGLAFLGKSAGGFLLFGGFWVILFGIVCWRTVESFGDAIEADSNPGFNIDLLLLKLTGLLLSVMLVQIVLYTLGVLFLDGDEFARKALFFFIGVAGSTTILVPAYFWFRSHRWLQPVVAVLLFAGLIVWWEVVRNLWPDELFLGPVIGLVTFALSALLLRWALKLRAPNRTTQQAMDELEQGKGKRFDSAEKLFEDLGS